MKTWVFLLGVAAGLGPVVEEAFADRGRRGHSSVQQHRPHHQIRPHQHRPHHARPHRQHRFHARPHRQHRFHARPPRIVVLPSFVPNYAPAPVYIAPPVVVAPPVVIAPQVLPH